MEAQANGTNYGLLSTRRSPRYEGQYDTEEDIENIIEEKQLTSRKKSVIVDEDGPREKTTKKEIK